MDCSLIGDIFFDVTLNQNVFQNLLIQGGTQYAKTIRLDPGGVGNVAVGLKKLGGLPLLIGKLGNDSLGRLYEADLDSEGVVHELFVSDSHPTGIMIVSIDSRGERSFLISRGANDFLSMDDVKNCRKKILDSKCLFVSGYSLVTSPQEDAISYAVKMAKKNGATVIFDIGSYNLVTQKRDVFEGIIDFCDILSSNLCEAKAFTKEEQISRIAKKLSIRVPFVALKLGSDGCLLVKGKTKFRCPANAVHCVDTTGAGDAFNSVLIYSVVNDLDIKTTARLANWYASYNVKTSGPRSFPTEIELSSFFSALNSV
jgi:sugar/nucleoside kinase (ribokinase family)